MKLSGRRISVDRWQLQLHRDGLVAYSDLHNLARERERLRVSALLRERFPEIGDKDLEPSLLELLALEPEQQGRREGQADVLFRLVEKSGTTLFHDEHGDAYASVPSNGHVETLRVKGREFRKWVIRSYLEKEGGKVPYGEALSSALGAVESKTGATGERQTLSNRIAVHDGAIYYDLGDESWRAVRVTPAGWSIEASTPVPLFRRYAHQRPQVTPLAGGDPFVLARFVNLKDDMARLLLVVYAVSCLVPDIPHPILIVHGPGGSAKTTLSRLLRLLIDPSALPVISFPRDERELVQKLSHHWLAPFDNVSTLTDWVQDCLCRASTGEGFSKRELYSDDEDIIYSFRRCLLLNGINVAGTHSDLLRRSILLGLEEIVEENRRPEKEIMADFEAARSLILGGMFDTLSKAMTILPTVRLAVMPSMADFALWGAAISKALGKGEQAFLQAYAANLSQQNAEAIEGSLVAGVILGFMEDRESWEGTASQLYSVLKTKAEELNISVNDRQWPRNPNWLVRSINRVVTNLRVEGLLLEWERSSKKRLIRLFWKKGKNVVTEVISSSQIRIPGGPDMTASFPVSSPFPEMSSQSEGLSSPALPSSAHASDGNDEHDVIPPSPAEGQQDEREPWDEFLDGAVTINGGAGDDKGSHVVTDVVISGPDRRDDTDDISGKSLKGAEGLSIPIEGGCQGSDNKRDVTPVCSIDGVVISGLDRSDGSDDISPSSWKGPEEVCIPEKDLS
ncbi:MAG: hypothetical protein Q7R39_00945 [Dehalococcoidia bacterium]|nr:hypothetical protein [Dehalococcoidia bacterium]